MSRKRISTTVDDTLLTEARRIGGGSDASVMDQALRALINAHRAAEIDAQYATAYDTMPLDAPDEWGDLASFRAAAGR